MSRDPFIDFPWGYCCHCKRQVLVQDLGELIPHQTYSGSALAECVGSLTHSTPQPGIEVDPEGDIVACNCDWTGESKDEHNEWCGGERPPRTPDCE